MEVNNKKWTDKYFLNARKDILAEWPTGKDVDLDEAVAYQQRLPDSKVFPKKLAVVPKPGMRMSCGWATSEQTIAHMQALEKAGADFINWEPDSYTRKHRFQEAQTGLERSLKLGKSMLNGYPFVNHGLKECRRVAEQCGLPLMFNGNNDEEPMILAEIGFAAGCTSNGVHDFRDLATHSKNYPLDKRIWNNQYVCKLAGYYTERGCPITMWPFGCLLNYAPASIGLALAVLECLTAAEQGVKYLVVDNELRGNLVQDVAALWALRNLTKDYIARGKYDDVTVWISTYSWLGAWPTNQNAAAAFLAWLMATTALAGADLIASKSIAEAVGVTSLDASVKSTEINKQITHIARHQVLAPNDELKEEQRFIEMEVKAIVDKVIELGKGDHLVGTMRAVETGVLDAPFSSWQGVKGKLMPMRDRKGAFRYLDHGNLPFSQEIIDYHRAKIAEREKAEGRKAGVETLVEDIDWLSKDL